MAPDYKRAAKTITKRHQRAQKKTKASRRGSAGLWLGCGLLIGLGLGGIGWYLATQWPLTSPADKAHQPLQSTSATTSLKATKKPSEDDDSTWHFDFYHLLPKMEIVISDEDITKAQNALPKAKPHGPFILQAGSFRHFKDADRLKARLALSGIEADIQSIVVNSGNTWHRVRIGPFTDMHTLKPSRKQLERMHIAFITLELAGQGGE